MQECPICLLLTGHGVVVRLSSTPRAHLTHPAGVHDGDPVVAADGVEPVGDGDDGAGGEVGLDGALDQVVRLHVHRGGGLVQQQDPVLTQQGAGQADELPLTHTARQETRRYREYGQWSWRHVQGSQGWSEGGSCGLVPDIT